MPLEEAWCNPGANDHNLLPAHMATHEVFLSQLAPSRFS